MQVNAMTEEFEHMELFGKSVLFTNAYVDKATVPKGWYQYSICGSDSAPGDFETLEYEGGANHVGTIISPEEIPFPDEKDYRPIRGSHYFYGEDMTIAEFCTYSGLASPQKPDKYLVCPAPSKDAGLFFAQTPEQDEKLGTIGHVRIDFQRSGKGFFHTWHPRGPQELNTPEFRAELGEVVDQLRESVLRSLSSMRTFCSTHGGAIKGGICTQNYGYAIETEQYRYLLRCNPIEGDYQAYLICFDKEVQRQNQEKTLVGRVTFASGEQIEYTDPSEYLKMIQEELPYHATTGFRYETLTNDPEVRKAVDDALYDLYGEENPRRLEDYQEQPNEGMTMGGMQL